MLRKLVDIVLILALCGAVGFGGFQLGKLTVTEEPIEITQHDNCYDNRTHYAWIARRGDHLRCFEEQRNYPYRVRASNLD